MNDICPRLIEVALPIREISAESVRDKGLPQSHISRLHKWWARRPLAASRAVVFASLVPDPDDPTCPEDFKEAVERFLKTDVPSKLRYYMKGRRIIRDEDPYRPYKWLDDTLRNRLLMFIAKWSPETLAYEKDESSKKPKPAELLDDRCLVKWETSHPENQQGRVVLKIAQELIRIAHDGQTPTVLDPFAGGGAIPLEAGRLGCKPIANDYNPVAYLILRATCEFPQKYGKPGKRKVIVEEFGKKKVEEIEVPNVLVHDVEKRAKWILERAKDKIGYLYPPGKDGRPVVAYLWARTAPCSNPSCRGEIPLLRSLLICNKKDKKVALTMEIDKKRKEVSFGIAKGKDIKDTNGTVLSKGAKCPFCGQTTATEDIKQASFDGSLGEKMVAVIVEDSRGKDYRPVEETDIQAFNKAKDLLDPYLIPNEPMPDAPDLVSGRGWNFKTWGNLFNTRQLVAIQTLIKLLQKAIDEMSKTIPDSNYKQALALYLGLWIDRIAVFGNNVSRWRPAKEEIENPFDGQAIRMILDYPEINPLANSSGTASTQLHYMLKVLEHETAYTEVKYHESDVLLGSANSLPLNNNSVDYVITDPPYYDAINYADLSDFFYVWLKRSIGMCFPEVFTTPLTPKSEEATSLKHRHEGSIERARNHYRRLLKESFSEMLRIVSYPKLITVMFAHQSTEAWTSLITALFDAGLTPFATWPIATEMPKTALALGTASLESSVTVVCRPRLTGSATSFKDVKKEIEKVVQQKVKEFWSYGLRGADLIVACYGPAVGVFGKYERVEKADGTPVEIPELLELARKAARDAIAGEFQGDGVSTLYYVWANLYGISEQAWDDARLVVQVGGEDEDPFEVARRHGIFVVDGSKCRLALLTDRANRRGLGIDQNPPFIDALHRAMIYWKEENRSELVSYLAERGLLEDGPFWKLAQALFEVLPKDIEDWKIVSALLSERETLKAEGKKTIVPEEPYLL